MMKTLFIPLFVCLFTSSFGQVNLNQGLVGFYPFSGNTNEVTGLGLNGIPRNGAQLTTDRFGTANSAYYFDGLDDFIQVPSNETLNPTTAFSIALYFNTESSAVQTLVGKIAYMAGVGTQYQVAINFPPVPGVLYGTNPPSNGCAGVPLNGAYVNTGAGSISNNQWYCIAATYENQLMKIYLNGALIQTTVTPFNILNICSNADVQIGSWWNGDQQRFKGKIDDVRFYNRAINLAEVAALCNVAPVVPIQSPVVINKYTPLISLDKCKNLVIVENASEFNTGDTILLIQMKGAVIDSTNTAAFGTITNYNNAGNYEFNYVKSRSGNIIELKNNIIRTYDIPAGRVQLVRVPYYHSLITSAPLTCLAWDGSKGGVLVFNVRDTLKLQADLDVSGKGFWGGNSPNTGTSILYCNRTGYNFPLGAVDAAAKGEGITTIGSNILWGRGAPANGGGGGVGHNAGGGGGSNAGTGGLGGYQLLTCGNAPFDNRGRGGYALNFSNSQNSVFMGGGGGAGHVDNNGGASNKGGNGGGIIIVNSGTIISNDHRIISNGANASQCTLSTFSDCHDASGGGGAGGTILLQNNNLPAPVTLQAKGGKGGDVIIYNPAIGADKIGPGGGGGGGTVWISNPSVPVYLNTVVTAGSNGVISLDANNPWGATPGTAGTVLLSLAMPVSTSPFRTNIDSVRIKDSATSCEAFDFKGLAYLQSFPVAQWQWSFGDGATATTQNTIHTYPTAGTYNVKLVITDINGCKDSITRTVMTNLSDADFSYQQDVCNPLSIRFFGTGSNAANHWAFGDGNSISGTASPTHVYNQPGNYLVKYLQAGSCADTVTKNISVNVLWDNLILTPDTTICFNSTKQLRTQPALNFCWSPATFLNDPLSPNPTTSTPGPITYYFTAQVEGTNLVTNGNFNGGNTGFTSGYNYTSNNITEGQYFVGANPQAWNAALSPCGDHTTGSSNMMLVNGSPVPDVKVWNQTVAVTPNTNYAFSTWVQALYTPNPANLAFSINGLAIGNPITASLPTCNWTRFYTTWNSGNNTTAAISIVNKNTFVQGNDFALDDISFSPVLIKRDSVKISIDTPVVRTIQDTAACKGASVQLTSTGAVLYNWSPPTGLNSTTISNPLASPVVTTQYIVTGTNVNGCTAKDTVIVGFKQLPAISISTPDTVCINQRVQLTASGGIAYSWNPTITLNNPNIPDPVATASATTTYTVTVTGANNCVNKDSVTITLKALPAFAVAGNVATCVNGKAQLSASGGTNYLWSPAALLNNATIANPVATVPSNTLFQVIIRDSDCNLSDTLFTTVSTNRLPPPVTAAKSNDMDCVFNSVQLTAIGADSYTWSPSVDLSSNTIANPVASPTVTRQYTVTGINTTSNCSGTDTITVFVKAPAAPKAYIPNAFSPNNDGVNDCFRVKDFGTVKTADIIIYNRYGNLVFQTKNPLDCWDGTYKGMPSEPGNYVYYIKVINDCGEEIKKGNLLLLR
jgi:gliding motility-associated-like protein